MPEIRVGINGFGRIGRCALKQMLDCDGFRVVGINDVASISDLAYLLKYDSAVSASQSRTVRSSPPDKTYRPSGE